MAAEKPERDILNEHLKRELEWAGEVSAKWMI